MKKRIIIITCAAAAIAALVCLAPWPTYINMDLTCSVLDAGGQVTEQFTATLQGWKLDFLFSKDTLDVTIRFPEGFRWKNLDTLGMPRLEHHHDLGYMAIPYSVFDSVTTGYDDGHLGLDFRNGIMIIDYLPEEDAPYIVGTVHSDNTPDEILQHFSFMLDFWYNS